MPYIKFKIIGFLDDKKRRHCVHTQKNPGKWVGGAGLAQILPYDIHK
jgi:hypothetical protein